MQELLDKSMESPIPVCIQCILGLTGLAIYIRFISLVEENS